ncbi:MAG: DUF460 domain-containing protein [Methanosarcinaceae archaeon]|nr:DUF460 domain-containing protein [Methanosarcinaceae archaeon]MDD4749690.1 DUF460 domain-containing protein [Methanosarcinaceae archaeon]
MQEGGSAIIYGIDISRGSPRARALPRYALAILKDGEISHYSMLRRQKVLNMIQKDRPDLIAVDNIFELAADKKELLHITERLPAGVRLVQVTGGIRPEPLVRLGRKHGFFFDPTNPNEEAEVCARLADMGIGDVVSLFEDLTRIKVSRARSLGRGGWSQNRYRRKVHGAVLQRSREIESILRELSRKKGIKYEVKNVKGFGGYVRSEFIVYAKRGEIPIHPMLSNDVQVSVKSVEREKIRYEPLEDKKPRRRFTIVGIDPGTTVGLAVLSFEGELLFLKSIRGIAAEEVIKKIAEYGKPAVVASDVSPMPGSVEKIRRSFNAVPASPGVEIPAEEKIALAKPFGYANDHERDALTAALWTYKSYRKLFSRIEKKAPETADLELIKLYVIQGTSIDTAIEKASASKTPKGRGSKKPEKDISETAVAKASETLQKLRASVRMQGEQIQNLQAYVKELKREKALRDQKILKLEASLKGFKREAYKEIRKEKELQIRESKIEALKRELKKKNNIIRELRRQSRKLKKLRKMEVRGEGTPVKVVGSFTKEAVAETKARYGLKAGDVLFLENPSGGGAATAQILIEAKIKAVLVPEGLSHAAEEAFFKGNLPVLKNFPLERVDDFALADPEVLETEIAKWAKAAEKKRVKAREDELESLLDEYRSERRRGLL